MKDYKKILEGVVDIINVTEKSDIGFANICTYIGENCPEFKESEDERIRKEILDCFKAMKQQGCFPSKHKEQYDSWIAWLKKQGEHAKFCDSIQVGDKITRNEDGVLVNLSQLKRVAKKQGEQKPADNVEPKFKVKYAGSEYNVLEVKDIAGVTYYGIEDEPNHIDYVQAENCERVGGYSIKEKGSPYPTKPAVFSAQNPTWSEEDEAMWAEISNLLWEGYKQSGSKFSWDNIRNWVNPKLKSLKDRYTWKPSEEQIEALDSATENCAYSEYQDCLRELIGQLKKLRRE